MLRLPGTVLFPGLYILLHVGEESFAQVIDLAASNQGYLCVVLPANNHNGIELVGCLAQIVERQPLKMGENVRLVGLARMKLRMALETDRGPLVEGETLRDARPVRDDWDDLLDRLEEAVQPFDFPKTVKTGRKAIPESIWLDSVAFYLPLAPPYKQLLLQELDPVRRVGYLLKWLSQLHRHHPQPRFPRSAVN